MKRFLITTIIFLFVIGLQAQTASSSRKWNDLYKRYEYFDSKGQMTGYEKWNKLYGKWEYFENRNYRQPNTSTYSNYEYKSPYNIELIERGLALKQQQFDKKMNNINEIWGKINYEIEIIMDNNLQLTKEQNDEIIRYSKTITGFTNGDVDKNYNNVISYMNQVYSNIHTWRINASRRTQTQSQNSYQQQSSGQEIKKDKYPPGLYAVSKGTIIHQNPDNNSKILLQMRDGGTVRVIDKVQNTAFYKVEADGTIGYMWVTPRNNESLELWEVFCGEYYSLFFF